MKKGVIALLIIFCIIVLSFVIYLFINRNNKTTNYNENGEIGEIIASSNSIKDMKDLKKYDYNTEEIIIKNKNNQSIYGVLYKPVTGNKMPIVIYSHGLGGSHYYGEEYARVLATYGIGAYCFDFRGGSSSSKSDGKTTEMSVMTEADDLETVIEEIKTWDFVDSDKIVLLGTSQGGAVSSLVSSRNPDEVAGAMILYPALVITDMVHESYSNINDIPEASNLMGWIRVGRNYYTDVWDLDFYEEMKKDNKKILIIHGTNDSIVPISYSEKANKTYKDSEFYKIQGAGHGFSGSQFDEAITYIFNYLQEIGILENNETSSSDNIISDLKEIPNNYFEDAENQGKVVRLDYNTNSYDSNNTSLSKYCYVYLPYGYDENDNTKYNVFYVLHGGGGNPERYFDGEGRNSIFKNMLDNMIQNKELEPLIVVAPTFYDTSSSDNSISGSDVATKKFHTEVINDLIPSVETKYNTYLNSSSKEDIENSREHRAFGGFSMGSVATWYEYIYDLDYFKYFMPMSGDSWILGNQASSNGKAKETAEYLDNIAKNSKYKDNFFIYALTGTSDIAYNSMNNQIEAMKGYCNNLKYIPNISEGSYYFNTKENGTHDYTYIRQYIYNALPTFWTK